MSSNAFVRTFTTISLSTTAILGLWSAQAQAHVARVYICVDPANPSRPALKLLTTDRETPNHMYIYALQPGERPEVDMQIDGSRAPQGFQGTPILIQPGATTSSTATYWYIPIPANVKVTSDTVFNIYYQSKTDDSLLRGFYRPNPCDNTTFFSPPHGGQMVVTPTYHVELVTPPSVDQTKWVYANLNWRLSQFWDPRDKFTIYVTDHMNQPVEDVKLTFRMGGMDGEGTLVPTADGGFTSTTSIGMVPSVQIWVTVTDLCDEKETAVVEPLREQAPVSCVSPGKPLQMCRSARTALAK